MMAPMNGNDHELELSSFQMDYRPVAIRTNKQHEELSAGAAWYYSTKTRRQKTLQRWLCGLIVVGIVFLLIRYLSPSSTQHAKQNRTETMPSNESDKRIHHESFKLLPADETELGHFGMTIVMNTDSTVWISSVSAPSPNGTKYVGSVYAFDTRSTTQEMKFEMQAPEIVEFSWFGEAMAITDDNTLFIGAPGINKVFEYTIGDTPTHAELKSTTTSVAPPQNTDLDSFGSAVAYQDDYLFIGEPFAEGKSFNTSFGLIHVYKRALDGSFEEIQTLKDPSPQPGEMYGESLVYRNGMLVVGDFLKTTPSGLNSGCVYIYQQRDKTSGMFDLTQTLEAADGGAAHDGFGASVAISDTVLVVGLGYREGRTMPSLDGGAFVYRWQDDGSWKFESLLRAHDQAIVKGQFGGGVAVWEETIVVGSQELDEDRAGKVYVFRKNKVTAKWEDVAELAPSDPSEGHHFGRIISIYNTTVVVGAFMDDELKRAGGSAYVFHLDA